MPRSKKPGLVQKNTTLRRRHFLRLLHDPGSETFGNIRDSATAAGLNVQTTYAWWAEARKEGDTKTLVARIMDENGLTFDRIYQRVGETLEGDDPGAAMTAARLALQSRGVINNDPKVQQFIVSIGAQDENDVRKAYEFRKSLDGLSLADGERDAVEALRLIMAEDPGAGARIRAALFGERQVEAEDVVEAGEPE